MEQAALHLVTDVLALISLGLDALVVAVEEDGVLFGSLLHVDSERLGISGTAVIIHDKLRLLDWVIGEQVVPTHAVTTLTVRFNPVIEFFLIFVAFSELKFLRGRHVGIASVLVLSGATLSWDEGQVIGFAAIFVSDCESALVTPGDE